MRLYICNKQCSKESLEDKNAKMNSLSYLFPLVLLVCVIPQGVNGLKCHYCSNIGGTETVDCGKPQIKTCSAGEDQCITIKIEGKNPQIGHQMALNCSNTANCDEKKYCTEFNSTNSGSIKACSVGCCKGDLCNKQIAPTAAPGGGSKATSISPNATMVTTKTATKPAPKAAAPSIQVASGLACLMAGIGLILAN